MTIGTKAQRHARGRAVNQFIWHSRLHPLTRSHAHAVMPPQTTPSHCGDVITTKGRVCAADECDAGCMPRGARAVWYGDWHIRRLAVIFEHVVECLGRFGALVRVIRQEVVPVIVFDADNPAVPGTARVDDLHAGIVCIHIFFEDRRYVHVRSRPVM